MNASFGRYAGYAGTVLVVGLALRIVPVYAAGITLPFATTYSCAEQAQGSPGWVTCDGIFSNGDWTTSNGSREQITSAANYPGGAGGRGQRHWIGQSSGNTNGSGGVWYRFAPVQEVYVRWYVRWQAGLKLGGNAQPIARNHKIVYFSGGGCGQPGGCYFDIQGNNFGFIVNGYDYHGGTGWDGMFRGSNAPSDGRWIVMEIRLKNSTGGLPNGIAQWWVDGVLQLNATNVDMKGSTGFAEFEFPNNHQFTTVAGGCCDMYEDLDDVAIRTTGPIGPLGGTLPPTPPAPPTNLQIIRAMLDGFSMWAGPFLPRIGTPAVVARRRQPAAGASLSSAF
jgi:hypothetical protein